MAYGVREHGVHVPGCDLNASATRNVRSGHSCALPNRNYGDIEVA